MEHLLLKAAVTAATDKGEFTAVISTATIDREKDIVDPAGFVRALRKWVPLGKKVPLAWNHSGRPEDQIGCIDPATVQAKGNEVIASGKIDLDTPNGAHAWRLAKAGTLGFSFGYLVPSGGSIKRAGGGRHIHELDVFEVTATPTPMNADTRVLDYKAIKGHADVGPHARDKLKYLIRYYMGKPHPFTECVHDNAKRFGPDGADRVCATLKDVGMGTTHWRNQHGKAISDVLDPPVNDEPTDADLENMCQALLDASDGNVDGLMAMWLEHMHNNGDGPTAPGKALSAGELRRKADALERELVVGTKQTVDDSEDEDDPAELIGQMISQAQDFIDDEDDPNDVAAMREVMNLLLRLQGAEVQEPADEQPPPPKSISELRRRSDRLEFEHRTRDDLEGHVARAELRSELASTKAQLDAARDEIAADDKDVKAMWDTSYINLLPDSAFLYITPGGSKDGQGKTTPRTLRSFPYRDVNGKVDVPHLRNALARIPQSKLSQDVKDMLTIKAQRLLDDHKSVDETDQERKNARSVDPLRRLADAVALDFLSDGESRRKPPRQQEAPRPQPELSIKELKRRAREEMLTALSGEPQ